jgi:hypothetical protein
MASLISGLAKEIFQILKGSGRVLSLFDEHGNKVFEPESAQSFFAEPDKLMVTINADGADSSLNMYVSETSDIDDMKKMIDTMRIVATRYNFLFNIRKYGKELNPKDFAFRATPMVESMYGSSKTSYQNIGKSKLIVRHTSRVNEESRGSRSRRISSIFVETAEGERFKFPNVSLHGARAFAKHLDSGGDSRDNYSTFIFDECDKQQLVSGFRRRIRKLGESNEEIAELNSLLKNVVEESKSKIMKAKGNRFYSGIVEQITKAPNHIGPLKSEIAEQAKQLRGLLAIDEQSALFDSLDAVASIILEMKQMNPINFEEETMLKTYVSEQVELLDDLVESLIGEFGLEEGVHFERLPSGVSLLDEALLEQTSILTDGISGLTLQESAQDKFLAYATQWTTKRLQGAGLSPDEINKEMPKQAEELAMGLKQVVSGNLPITIKNNSLPKFPDPRAGIMFKLDKVIEPGSGLKNDALFNYISAISHNIEHGKNLDQNERFFATRIADLVDKHAIKDEAIMPEMNELEEWMKGYGLQESPQIGDLSHLGYRGVVSRSEAQAYTKVHQEMNVPEYMKVTGNKDFETSRLQDGSALDPDEMTYSMNYLQDSVEHYLRKLFTYEGVKYENLDLTDLADTFIDEQVKPYLEKIGFVFTANESLDEDLFADDLNEEVEESVLNGMINDALSKLNPNDYTGIFTGDDEYEEGTNLMYKVASIIGDEISSQIHNLDVDNILELARAAWSNKTESVIDEAGNYPDDYNDNANPHNGNSFAGSTEEEDVFEYMINCIDDPNGPVGRVTSEWFDGEDDNAVLEDLVSEVIGKAEHYSENRWDVNVVEDSRDQFEKAARQALIKKFGLDGKVAESNVNAGDDAIDADQGDDFVDDISYKQDAAGDAEDIARLRKLAGL